MELWKTYYNLCIDNINIINYNKINIKRKESRMDEKTMKELEEAHKKAMEGLKAFNDAAKETIDYGKKSIGL